MARGRPRETALLVEIHLHLRLRAGEDDDLIHFLSNIPNRRRVSAVKSALRAGGVQSARVFEAQDEAELAASVEEFLK